LEKYKKLLIIGGTGFFGKSILDTFQRGGLEKYSISEVIVIARNITKLKNEYPELIKNNVQLISGDIGELNEIPYADIIIHAASSTNKQDYIMDGQNQKNNIEKATFNYCKLAKVNHKNSKIVYCSSGAVYGQQPPNIDKISEDFDFNSIKGLAVEKRNYAIGKRNSEESIIQLGEEGLSVSIARCFAFYGKYLPKDQHFAYGNFISRAEKGEAVQVNAINPVYRSYMSADDLVDSLIIIALNSDSSCPIYNVGSDEAILIHDLAKKIAAEYKVSCEMNEISELDNVDRYVPNTNKLKNLVKNFQKISYDEKY
jgi:nucleoside-diphosphate-sugar epimerase